MNLPVNCIGNFCHSFTFFKSNPFFSDKTVSNITNIFGNNNVVKNKQNNQTQNIFESFSKGSLFG